MLNRTLTSPSSQTQSLVTDNAEPLLTLSGLSKRYRPQDDLAVRNVDLTLQEGEILALLGPSGCGKTTTLRMIAGFEEPLSGDILLGGKSVLRKAPKERNIGIVFQDYALFPHLNLVQNVGFGIHHLSGQDKTAKALQWLDLVGLGKLAKRMPDELSGGQQQRVALARTLAAEPRLVLLDEPFSNLDAALRESTRIEVRALLKKAGTTAILVTHDQAEALSFADKVGVMNQGALEQIGAPEDVYHHPKTAFVAEFLGHTNLLTCRASGHNANSPLGPIRLAAEGVGDVLISMRPEHLDLRPVDATDNGNCEVISREFRGHDNFYRVTDQGIEYKVLAPYNCVLEPGDRAVLSPRQPGVIVTP